MEEDRYDRQLRLWGWEAQRMLHAAHVVVLGVTVSGIETIKNLLLSGVGSVTLVDDEAWSPVRNAATHFFAPPPVVAGSGGGGEGGHSTTPANITAIRSSSIGGENVPSFQFLSEVLMHPTGTLAALNPESRLYWEGVAPDIWADRWYHHVQQTCLTASGSALAVPTTTVNVPRMMMMPTLVLVSAKYADWSPLSSLARAASLLRVPLVYLESHGLVGGWVAVHHPADGFLPTEVPVEEATRIRDLRPFTPFPSLRRWMLQKMRSPALGRNGTPMKKNDTNDNPFGLRQPIPAAAPPHPPYLMILYVAYERWRRRAAKTQPLNTDASSFTDHWQPGKTATPRLSAEEYKVIRSEISQMLREQEEDGEEGTRKKRGREHRVSMDCHTHSSFSTAIPVSSRWLTSESVMEALQHCDARLNRASQLPWTLRELLDHPFAKDPGRAPWWGRRRRRGGDGNTSSAMRTLEHFLHLAFLSYSCPAPQKKKLIREKGSETEKWSTSSAFVSPPPPPPLSHLLLLPSQRQVLAWYVIHGIRCFYHQNGESEEENEGQERWLGSIRSPSERSPEGDVGCFVKTSMVDHSDAWGDKEDQMECPSSSPAHALQRDHLKKEEEEEESPRLHHTHTLPYNGFFPDMHTTTAYYNELRQLYRHKHERDIEWVVKTAWHKLWDDIRRLRQSPQGHPLSSTHAHYYFGSHPTAAEEEQPLVEPSLGSLDKEGSVLFSIPVLAYTTGGHDAGSLPSTTTDNNNNKNTTRVTHFCFLFCTPALHTGDDHQRQGLSAGMAGGDGMRDHYNDTDSPNGNHHYGGSRYYSASATLARLRAELRQLAAEMISSVWTLRLVSFHGSHHDWWERWSSRVPPDPQDSRQREPNPLEEGPQRQTGSSIRAEQPTTREAQKDEPEQQKDEDDAAEEWSRWSSKRIESLLEYAVQSASLLPDDEDEEDDQEDDDGEEMDQVDSNQSVPANPESVDAFFASVLWGVRQRKGELYRRECSRRINHARPLSSASSCSFSEDDSVEDVAWGESPGALSRLLFSILWNRKRREGNDDDDDDNVIDANGGGGKPPAHSVPGLEGPQDSKVRPHSMRNISLDDALTPNAAEGPSDVADHGHQSDSVPSTRQVHRVLASWAPLWAEIWRQQEVELPSVAASVGALAAQEVVKLLQQRRIVSSSPIFYSGYSNAVHTWEDIMY